MPAPNVSVILPTYNRVAYLRDTIASVLVQSYPDWELIIADDGSDAATREFLASYEDSRITHLWLAHSGNPGAVRNRALERARGGHVAFLDSDDVWSADKLERQLNLLESRPECRWSYTGLKMIDKAGHPFRDPTAPHWVPYDGDVVEALLTWSAGICLPSVMSE